MKVFHHNDPDGRLSAFLVGIAKGFTDIDKFIEMDYNSKFPIDSIVNDEEVIIVDYSLRIDDMKALFQKTNNVVWIDHHKSAILAYSDYPHPIPGIRKEDFPAACALVAEYYGIQSCQLIDLVSDHDTFVFKYGEMTKNFRTALDMEDQNPVTGIWRDVYFNPQHIPEMVARGELLRRYQAKKNEDFMKRAGYRGKYLDYNIFCINTVQLGSEQFAGIEADIYVPFFFNGKQYRVGMYSSVVDVSAIAKLHGGGGHVGAAGFFCDKDKLPTWLIPQ